MYAYIWHTIRDGYSIGWLTINEIIFYTQLFYMKIQIQIQIEIGIKAHFCVFHYKLYAVAAKVRMFKTSKNHFTPHWVSMPKQHANNCRIWFGSMFIIKIVIVWPSLNLSRGRNWFEYLPFVSWFGFCRLGGIFKCFKQLCCVVSY